MKNPINGVLLLDKAKNISSNQALQQIKRLYDAQKAGHTGTLDPMATGLLPICLGEARKYSQYLLNAPKSYQATLRLGIATTTGDEEGEIILSKPIEVQKEEIIATLQSLLGPSKQTPPMYSAIKYQGQPLYYYARQGIEIERESRNIEIYKLQLLDFNFPHITFTVNCSKGTYIRTLAEEIAKRLNTVGHLTSLIRTESNQFLLTQAYKYEQLKLLTNNQLITLLLPTDSLVNHFPQLHLDDQQIQDIKHGKLVQFPLDYEIITTLRIYSADQKFLGLVDYLPEHHILKTLRLMSL